MRIVQIYIQLFDSKAVLCEEEEEISELDRTRRRKTVSK